jgi:zinc transporter
MARTSAARSTPETQDAAAPGGPNSPPPGQTLPGLVWAFQFTAGGAAEEFALDQPLPDRSDGWLWLHFNLADARACRFLQGAASVPPAARDLLIDAEEHQQLHARDDCLYGVVADLVCGLDGVTEEIGFLHFAMTERLFVSGRRRALNGIEATRKALRAGTKIASVTELLDKILEHGIDAIDHYAEDVARRLDRIEERILVDDVDEGRQVLGRVRRTNVRLHRQLVILRALMQHFELDLRHNIAFPLAATKLSQRLDWLDTEIVSLRDRAQLLQEEVTIKTAEQTNRNLHVLAIVTTVFLPASLIAGIFGMNVGGVPLTQDRHGFLWSMVILAGASAIVLWLLKRSGIFGR